MFTIFAAAAGNYVDIYNWMLIVTVVQDIAFIGYMVKGNKG